MSAKAGDGASRDRTHYVRMPTDRQAQRSFVARGVSRGWDYGTFVWLEMGSEAFGLLRSSGLAFEERPSAFTLRLGEQSFDPTERVPEFGPAWSLIRTGVANLHLVQFNGPTRAEWLDQLEQNGMRVVTHLAPCAYVVWGDGQALGRVAAINTVRWTGPFVNGYRVLPRWRQLDDTSVQVNVLLVRSAPMGSTLREIELLGGHRRGHTILNEAFELAEFTLAGNALQAVSQLPGVYSIQLVPQDGGLRGEMSNQLNVNNVDAAGLALLGYQAWLGEVGLSGDGVTVAAVDEGAQDDHPDLAGRFRPCNGSTCGGNSAGDHGTHTAGIIAADGTSGVMDALGFLRGLGMAPGARLVEQLFSPFFLQADGILRLMGESYNNGASLSNNSWGTSSTPRGYDVFAMMVDIGVRDADASIPGNQPLTYVLAIENGRGGTGTQGSPDEAKNLFAVGSTKMQESGGAQDARNADLSSNTAHGPAMDGRSLPHMVAPGCWVDSTAAFSGHRLLCGTSMAAPHVSGAVALFIEHYRNTPSPTGGDPSPALIKAAFLVVARDLAGHLDADGLTMGHPFDSKQGWGRLDVDAVLRPRVGVRYFDESVILDNTGEEWGVALTRDDPDAPMRLMLVWTDAPGHGLGGTTPAWNNDLDLVVEAGTDVYHGNDFGVDGWSQPGSVADFKNNTEGVFLGPTAPAQVTVRVLASDINSDGVPGMGDATDQDFALACYNCSPEPGFTLAVTPRRQDICVGGEAAYVIDVGQFLGFNDPVSFDSAGAPGGSTTSFSPNPVVPPDATLLTITNTSAAGAGDYDITIDAVAAGITQRTNVALSVIENVPAPIAPGYPSTGASNVVLRPTLSWSPGATRLTYDVQVATDASFTNIVESATRLTDANHAVSGSLAKETVYFWRVRAANACGSSAYSSAFRFTTRNSPAILLVDDDDNEPDVRSYYTEALETLGQAFDIWDTQGSADEPDASTLSFYKTVIWFSGGADVGIGGTALAGPTVAGETALSLFLDEGHCLWISAQDYQFARGLTDFMADYLGVASIDDFAGHFAVTGAGSVFAALGTFQLSFPLTIPNFTDRVSPDDTAELAFAGNFDDAAVNKDSGVYRTTFWGFPFEVMADVNGRLEVMDTTIEWCAGLSFEDCNKNGIADEDELAEGTATDCNVNDALDECDIRDGTSPDENGDGVPDECLRSPLLEPGGVRKNRYLSFDPNNTGVVAFRIELTERICQLTGRPCVTASDCTTCSGTGLGCGRNAECAEGTTCNISGESCDDVAAPVVLGWIGSPFDPGCENEDGSPKVPAAPCRGEQVSRVVSTPISMAWPDSVIHVADCEIASQRSYSLRSSMNDGATFSNALAIGTIATPNPRKRGDVVGAFSGTWSGPNGVVGINDVVATLAGFSGEFDAPHTTWLDVHPEVPNYIVDLDDVLWIAAGFRGQPYPFADPSNCP